MRKSFAVLVVLALPLLASCKKSVGDLRTVDVAADAAGTPAAPTKVSVELKAGELHLVPGGVHTVGGSVRSNVKDLDPKVDPTPGAVHITQGTSDLEPSAVNGEVVADWRLTLGSTPMELSVDAKAAKTELDLSGLALKSLTVRSAAGSVDVSAKTANPMTADLIDVESGAGALTLKDLGNLGAAKVRVHTGAGSVTLDMGKRVDREMTVDVEATAGSINITMPLGVGARAEVQGGKVTGTGWDKDGDAWVVTGGAPAKVTFKIKAGAGVILLNAN